MTNVQEIILPACPSCGSTYYHIDATTGVPTHCKACGINASHIEEELILQCRAVKELDVEETQKSGVPICGFCKQGSWRFDILASGGPYVTYCASCGKNFPHAQDPVANLQIICAQTGMNEEELYSAFNATIPVDILPNSRPIQNGNRAAFVANSEPEALNPEILNPVVDGDQLDTLQAKADEIKAEEEAKAIEEELKLAEEERLEKEKEDAEAQFKTQSEGREKRFVKERKKNVKSRKSRSKERRAESKTKEQEPEQEGDDLLA